MENFWQVEVIVNLILQSLGTWLIPVMRFFSFFGEEQFYILLLPVIYWCFDAGIAIRLTLLLIMSGYSNAILKTAFHGARPYWFDSRVQAFASEISFGMPSGHAQNAASIWGFFTTITTNKWLKFLFIITILFIGVSRLYLGVHFASDVLVGWCIGAGILLLFVRFEKPFLQWFEPHTLLWKILFISIITILMLAFGSVWLAFQNQTTIPESWAVLAQSQPGSVAIDPFSAKYLVTFAGVFWGIMVGYLWLSTQNKYTPINGTLRQKFGRIFLGYLGVILIVFGTTILFPSSSDLIGEIVRFIKYSLAGLWMSAFAPILFKKYSFM
jgi:membrane-associated phospholipid phosphatase